MAPRPFNLPSAISILVVIATFSSVLAGANTKSDVLKLNLHDTFNSTAYEVLRGPGSAPLTTLTAPFGSILVAQDPLTDRASGRRVGTAHGTSTISSFDGLTALATLTVSLDYHKYFGSLSFVGVVIANATSKMPIVGGTDDFLFAQGYLLYTPPKDTTTYTLISPLDIHIYWPPSSFH